MNSILTHVFFLSMCVRAECTVSAIASSVDLLELYANWHSDQEQLGAVLVSWNLVKKFNNQHDYNYISSYDGVGLWVTLPVTVALRQKERPKASLTMVPTGQMFSGETVTLRCDIQGHTDTGWRYSWYKDGDGNRPVHSSDDKTDYSFSAVESDSGTYTCRGERRRDSQRSEISNTVTLTVSGASPPVSLMVSPNRTQHFTTDSLSLSCEGQSDSTGWRVRRYTHSENMSECSSGWGSVTGPTCNISSLSPSHTGVYWCESESGESSNPVNITVHSSAAEPAVGLVGAVVGVTLTLLFIIVLILLCSYKTNKANQQNVDQTSDSGAMAAKEAATDEGDAEDKLSHVIYSEVAINNEGSQDEGQDFTEQDSQTEVIYSNLPYDKATGLGGESAEAEQETEDVRESSTPAGHTYA
ncbi:hypothetical protein NFI96_003749 [Prochilodus magdalenae]|nr:hypothetical protein NFI96_003749 [Prochilodus magdalenae]